ncbi:hypothetical protein LJR143_004150 [Pseudoxanthomonas sp. LjRoot143]|uniref:hypothetical protein n=1 Tax=Pseudoxanthomonas sp. LjRoot143 TaxID=3342266 RepID=UPI003ECE509E
MHRLSVITLLAAAMTAFTAVAGERTHYLDLINRAHDRVVSVAATPAGGTAWNELLHDADVPGGGGAITVQVAGEQCIHDVRVAFANGRSALYPAIDLCRHRGLRIQPLPAGRGKGMMAVQQASPADASPAGD